MTDSGERAIVQLAGCLMAAEGNTELVGHDHGTYGWSPAYEAVATLRARVEEHGAMLLEFVELGAPATKDVVEWARELKNENAELHAVEETIRLNKTGLEIQALRARVEEYERLDELRGIQKEPR